MTKHEDENHAALRLEGEIFDVVCTATQVSFKGYNSKRKERMNALTDFQIKTYKQLEAEEKVAQGPFILIHENTRDSISHTTHRR